MEISLENLYVDIVGGYCGICLCVSRTLGILWWQILLASCKYFFSFYSFLISFILNFPCSCCNIKLQHEDCTSKLANHMLDCYLWFTVMTLEGESDIHC